MNGAWVLAVVVMLSSLLPKYVHAQPVEAGTVLVTITGFRSDSGRALVALWRTAKGFPGTPPPDAPSRSVAITGRRASVRFEGVPAGDFAVTVFHDEDGDTELKENLLGIPKEGIGFSRNVRPRFRAPRFDEAKLPLRPGMLKQIAIAMIYL